MTVIRRCLFLALLIAPLPALAQGEDASWRERFNRAMFAMNHGIEDAARAVIDVVPEMLRLPEAVQAGLLNMLHNTVNEPISAAGHAITGRYDLAGRQLQRVGINLIAGYGGFVDRASERGIQVPMIDIGTALCVRGVDAGPYIVMPLIGPRTVRDGTADLVASNIAIFVMLVPFTGPVPPLGTFIAIQIIEELAAMAVARSFDPVIEGERSFDAVRDAYLDHRTRLCTEASARAPS